MNADLGVRSLRTILPGVLLVLASGCPSPTLVPEGTFTRPLREFARIEPRPLALDLDQTQDLSGRMEQAQAFSREYRKELLYRLHRRRILDQLEGPLLLLDGRLKTYRWTVTPGTAETPEQVEGTIAVSFTFLDGKGVPIGSGTVTATETGSEPRGVMERAEKRLVYSVYKFLRKEIGRAAEPEAPEPSVTP
jgi:hypothetical protein